MSTDPKTSLTELLHHLGFEATVEEHILDDQRLLDIKCEDPGRLIGRLSAPAFRSSFT